jgi:hypothetical protein
MYLVGKYEGNRTLGKPTCIWEDHIKMDLQKVGREVWTGLIWLKVETGGEFL